MSQSSTPVAGGQSAADSSQWYPKWPDSSCRRSIASGTLVVGRQLPAVYGERYARGWTTFNGSLWSVVRECPDDTQQQSLVGSTPVAGRHSVTVCNDRTKVALARVETTRHFFPVVTGGQLTTGSGAKGVSDVNVLRLRRKGEKSCTTTTPTLHDKLLPRL